MIAREELADTLAVSAAESTAVTQAGPERETASSSVPGSTVPPWRNGLAVTVLAPDYQRLLVCWRRAGGGQGPLKTTEIAVEPGLETTPAKVEGLRSKASHLAERGWLVQQSSGAFSAGRRPVALPVAVPSA